MEGFDTMTLITTISKLFTFDSRSIGITSLLKSLQINITINFVKLPIQYIEFMQVHIDKTMSRAKLVYLMTIIDLKIYCILS